MNTNLTRTEFERLLDNFADAHGAAMLAAVDGSERDYDEAALKAAQAREAVRKAVFP